MSWEDIRKEANDIVHHDEFMFDLIKEIITDHNTFSSALIDLLAKEFAVILSANKWKALFRTAYEDGVIYDDLFPLHPEKMGLQDLIATMERDPSSRGMVNPFMYFKGYKALQTHRIAHVLWRKGRLDAARAVQSRCSEIFGVDIHPAAIIGPGLFIDHGTGIVIGETSVIGSNCSFLHGVTLGSTGKEDGDRHPKIGHDVLIGCGATILGNIQVGDCCKIGSGSIVLKPLPCGASAVGNPARIVGRSLCPSAAQGMDLSLEHVVTAAGKSFPESWSIYEEGESAAGLEEKESRTSIP